MSALAWGAGRAGGWGWWPSTGARRPPPRRAARISPAVRKGPKWPAVPRPRSASSSPAATGPDRASSASGTAGPSTRPRRGRDHGAASCQAHGSERGRRGGTVGGASPASPASPHPFPPARCGPLPRSRGCARAGPRPFPPPAARWRSRGESRRVAASWRGAGRPGRHPGGVSPRGRWRRHSVWPRRKRAPDTDLAAVQRGAPAPKALLAEALAEGRGARRGGH